MKGTQTLLFCLASGNIPCRGFREAVEQTRMGELLATHSKEECCVQSWGDGHLWVPQHKAQRPWCWHLVHHLAFILSQISARFQLGCQTLCAGSAQLQAVEGVAQTPSLISFCPPSPNCTRGSLPKTFEGLWWVTFGCVVNLPWAKRATVTAVSCSSLIEAT